MMDGNNFYSQNSNYMSQQSLVGGGIGGYHSQGAYSHQLSQQQAQHHQQSVSNLNSMPTQFASPYSHQKSTQQQQQPYEYSQQQQQQVQYQYEESMDQFGGAGASQMPAFQPTQEEKMMTPLEKIQSNKWQLRKIGYLEIQQVFVGMSPYAMNASYMGGGFENNGDEDNSMSDPQSQLESYAPWLNNIISEKNCLALSDGLRAIEIFVSQFKSTLSNQILKYYIGDVLDKASLFKPLQVNIAMSIMNKSLEKGDRGFIAGELAKRMEGNNPKNVVFSLQVIKAALEQQVKQGEVIFGEDTIRVVFKASLGVLKHTSKEIRSTAVENLRLIYMQCEESYEEIAKAFLTGQRQVHLKEIEDLCKKTKKIGRISQRFRLIQENMVKNFESEKINKQVIAKGSKIDLLAVIPEKFFEIPQFVQPSQKKAKLEEMANNVAKLLQRSVAVLTHKDNKDYSSIFTVLISCLEESNFLVFNEALKCVKLLMKLMKNGIPLQILKLFLSLIIEQFRGPKARQYNSVVWNALDDCFYNGCCGAESLVELMLTSCENEKNLHMRIGCINWLGGRFIPHSLEVIKDSIDLLNIETQIVSQKGERLQKLIDVIDKKIEAISKKALNLQLKEACSYLLARKPNEYFNEYDKENSSSNHPNIRSSSPPPNNNNNNAPPAQKVSQIQQQQQQQQQQLDQFPQKSNKPSPQQPIEQSSQMHHRPLSPPRQQFNSNQQHSQQNVPANPRTNNYLMNHYDRSSGAEDEKRDMPFDLLELESASDMAAAAAIPSMTDLKKDQQQQQRKLSPPIVTKINRLEQQYYLQQQQQQQQLQLQQQQYLQFQMQQQQQQNQHLQAMDLSRLSHSKLNISSADLEHQADIQKTLEEIQYMNQLIPSQQHPHSSLNTHPHLTFNNNNKQSNIKSTFQQQQQKQQQQQQQQQLPLQKQYSFQPQSHQSSQQQQGQESPISNKSKPRHLSTDGHSSTSIGSTSQNNNIYNIQINQQQQQQQRQSQQQMMLMHKAQQQQRQFETHRIRDDFSPSEFEDAIPSKDNSESKEYRTNRHVSSSSSSANQIADNTVPVAVQGMNNPLKSGISNQAMSQFRDISPVTVSASNNQQQQLHSRQMSEHGGVSQVQHPFNTASVASGNTPSSGMHSRNQSSNIVTPSNAQHRGNNFINNSQQVLPPQQHHQQQFHQQQLQSQQDYNHIPSVAVSANNLYSRHPETREDSSEKMYTNHHPSAAAAPRRNGSHHTTMPNQNTYVTHSDIEPRNIQTIHQTTDFFDEDDGEEEQGAMDLISSNRYETHANNNNNNNIAKSGGKATNAQHSRLDSISPIIKHFDQLASNRHYFGSQEGKLNFSDISCLMPPTGRGPTNGSNNHNSLHANSNPNLNHHPLVNQYNSEDPWLARYKEERELHEKVRQDFEKVSKDLEIKEQYEEVLRNRLEDEAKAKEHLSGQVKSLQAELERKQAAALDLTVSRSINPGKIQGVSLQERYRNSNAPAITAPAKSPFELVPQKAREKTECIKQEILLTSEELYSDLGEQIINHYEGLEDILDKIDFVIDLKLAIIDNTLLTNMPDNNFRVVFMIALRLCTSTTTQKEIEVDKDQRTYRQNDLTKELLSLLDALLNSKSLSVIILSSIKVLNSSVPADLSAVYSKKDKMLFRLILKCIDKLLGIEEDLQDLRVFEILTEIYKFFKCHPPENLNETLPSLKDLEFIFRYLKTLSDQMISANHEKAIEFVEFVQSKHRRNIFLDYLVNIVNKIQENFKESEPADDRTDYKY